MSADDILEELRRAGDGRYGGTRPFLTRETGTWIIGRFWFWAHEIDPLLAAGTVLRDGDRLILA